MANPSESRSVALFLELPGDVTEEQARKLAEALRVGVLELGRALHAPGQEFKVHTLPGPANAFRPSDPGWDPQLAAEHLRRLG